MIKSIWCTVLMFIVFFFAQTVQAQMKLSPTGLWKTFDDQTGKEKSYVRISEHAGIFTGSIEKLVNPHTPDPKCNKCTDDRKAMPIIGMTIMRNVKMNAVNEWSGGDILDPESGKTYKVTMKLEDSGNKLVVRGYVGTPLLGRNQVWFRAD